MKKRLLSLLLVFVMVLGMIPTSVFAVEGIPFTVTLGDEEVTEITEGVVSWTDWSGTPSDVTCYTVTVPQGATEATLDFDEDMQWMYYAADGTFLGKGESSDTPSTTHTVAIQDDYGVSNGMSVPGADGELDGISVQIPDSWSTSYYIQFVYGTAACLTVKSDALTEATAKSGGLYQLKMSDVFAEADGHEVSYSYTFNSTADPMFTKLQDGVLYLTPTTQSPEGQPYDLVLTAECEGGKVTHTVKLTVDPPNEGIEQQYGYDETDKSSVTVYVTVSSDGMPLETDDGVLANLEITVPYFELDLYGLTQYNRYGTDGGRGPYVNNTVVRRPTGLHLYIYLLERYYMGLPEEQCCIGTSGVLEHAKKQDIYYMGGDLAYNSGNNKALVYSGGATSIFMNQFWGHDCNLMYYRNHCYPYMSPGWGSTSDYILLSDGDAIDVAMFTNWAFYHTGYFASFDQDVYEVAEGGSSITVKTQQWGTTAAAENFVPVNGNEGLKVKLYNSDWEEIAELDYDSAKSNTITVDVPEADGIYYLMAMDPNATDKNAAKVAPAVARIVVGDQNAGGADIGSYYEDCDFLNIKDDKKRYLVDITADTVATDYYGEIPTYQVVIEEGTETVYVTFASGNSFAEDIATYSVADRTTDYGWDSVSVTTNDDGTVTVAIPVANYTETGTGIILEDDQYTWKYGFDFVTGTITKVQVGTSVSRILLNSYSEHLWIGDTVTLVPTVLPAEATDWTIQWTSSDENIATVDQNGKITAVGDGTAIITAAIGDVKVQCTVTAEKYNTAPSVASGTPSWNKLMAGQQTNLDVSGWFADKEQTNLTFTAEIKKATAANFSQSYDYSTVAGPQVSVNGHNISVTVPDSGIYMLYVTASDGKLTTTHQCQLTVVTNSSGVIKLNDGVTASVYNVVVVGHTQDGNTHTLVLSKNTLRRQGANTIIKLGVTTEEGYSYSGGNTFGIGGQLSVTVKDSSGKSEQHIFKCIIECSGEHTDADDNQICDKCTLKIEKPGKFAFLAVNENGYIIEPCYVNYKGGETIKQALQNSGFDFAGIEQGYIGAVQGVSGSYMLHFDEDGYDLNTKAENVTALWITTNTRQSYSDALRDLVTQLARYNASTNGVKTYPAATTAYIKARQEFYDTSNAEKLANNLKAAIDAFETFMDGETVTVPMQIMQGGAVVNTGKAVFTSEFGTQVTTEDLTQVKLVPGKYTFDISDGGYQHVRGSIDVTAETSLQATLPTGKWMQDVQISLTSSAHWWKEVPTANETNAGATYYVPDYANSSIFCYIKRGGGVTDGGTHQVFLQGYESTRTWESYETTLPNILVADSLDGNTVTLECRLVQNPDGYEQYQTYTIEIVRSPSLWSLKAAGDGTAMKIEFEEDVLNYAVTTGASSVLVTPTVLDERTAVTVGGKAAVSGQGTAVKLADCETAEDGTYIIPVVLTAPSGATTTYTLQVTKVDTISVNLLVPDSAVSVKLYNAAGDEVMPVGQQGPRCVFKAIPGEEYTYISTKNTYYHATAKFVPETDNTTINVAEPKISAGLATFLGKTGTSNTTPKLPMDKEFNPAVHEYTMWMESNSGNLCLQANASNKNNYTVTAHYKSARNSAYSEYGSLAPKNEEVTIANKTKESAVKLNRSLGTGGWSNVFYIRMTDKTVVDDVTFYEEYILTVHRTMTLNTMSAADHNGNALVVAQKDAPTKKTFDKTVLDYTAQMPAFATNMKVTFKVQSSNLYAYDAPLYTVTVANGEQTQNVTFTEADIANAVTVDVPLSGTDATEEVTITVSHKEIGSVAQTYTLKVDKLPPVATVFAVDPADATIYLTDDISKARIYPDADGSYILNTDGSYTYVISKTGYVAKTAQFVASEENKTITVQLEKASASELKDISTEGDWLQFRADNNNNGVVNVKTPIKAEDAVLEWANKIGEGFDSGATGCPIIVGGYLYTYAGDAIHKVNKETGEVVKSGKMAGSSSFAINSPTYGNGMIFVALSNGRVQAFDAENLTSLWVYKDALGGQPNCPIAYSDGYIYTGFWNSETKQANFVCLTVTDEDTTNTTEAKLATWTYAHNGFYWAGAYACEDYVLVGTDDGSDGYTTGTASILSLHPTTGVLLDEQKLTNVGDQRSSIMYDAATDAYYFTTKGGDFYQIKVEANGTFTEDSLRRLHLDNGAYDMRTPPMSTSTPVIYNGRAYIGVSGISQFGNFSGHNMTVIDLETFSIAYTVPTMGYPQTSGLLTTAYENADGYVYVYFIDNASPGMIRVIRDKKGMDEVDHTYTTMTTYSVNGVEKTIETGYVLFTPYGDEEQYAICSPISDAEGNLYFKNDSARMMRLSSRMTSLEIVQQPEKKDYCVGKTFDGTGMKVIAHYANGSSKDVTRYVSFTTDPLTVDDTEITVSFAPDKMFENEDTAAGGYWQWYRDVNGQAGEMYYLPNATVTIELHAEHTWNDGEQTKAPTCTESGETTYTCDVCGDTKVEPVDAVGHSMTKTDAKAPTCTEDGNVEYYTCSVCQKNFADAEGKTELTTVVDTAKGHSMSKTDAKAPSCTEDGNVEYYTCSICQKNFADAEGKTELTTVVVPAEGHSMTKMTANAPSCTGDGNVEYYHCAVCNKNFADAEGKQELDVIVNPATGHSMTKKDAQAPTCTEDGNIAHYTCAQCGKKFADIDGKNELTSVVDPAKGHSMTKTDAKAPTCTEDGNVEYYTCSVCQKNYADAEGKTVLTSVVDAAKGHSMTKTDAKAPTCTEDGNVEYYTCSVCQKNFADAEGKTELTTVADPAKGHSMTKTDAKAPTCTEDGNVEYYTCSVCQKNFADAEGKTVLATVVDSAKGHKMGEYVVTKEPTTTQKGEETSKCANCDHTDVREIPVKVAPETKVEITEGGITTVPDSLKETGLDTPEKVNDTLVKAIIKQNGTIDEKNIAHYDVTLMYSEDGGKTWIKADESHWPASGKIKVTLPYPSGTDKTYSFTVVHMFTSSAFGKTPGDVEMPTVTNTDKGIEFEVTGLSPISVGWTAPKETPADPSTPATGDTTNVVLLTCVMLLSVTMLVVLLIASKKRRA